MAAVEAAAGGRSEGSPPLCQSPPAPPPSPGAATRGDGEPLQLLENIDEVAHKERPPILAASWRAATTPLASMRTLQNLHHITLLHVLQEGWKSSEESAQKELLDTIEMCMEKVKSRSESSAFEARLRYLIEVAKDPWHPAVLKNILEGVVPDSQQVLLWLRKEGCIGALERLRQLCEAKGQCEKAALRLALALLPIPPAAPLLSLSYRNRILEVLLILLYRASRTTECITHIKAMETNDAITIIARLASRNKSNGRIYKHARETALLCTQVSMATSLVKPLENSQLNTLATRLASLYASKIDELAPILRKLLNSADTAGHIYTVCRAIQSAYGDTMRSFVCELYIRALTTGVNELERLKLQDEAGGKSTTISHQLADWFVSLADYLSVNVTVSAECVLTAFSLYPSKLYYQRVIESAMLVKEVSTLVEPERAPSPEPNSDELFSRALDGLEADLQLLKMQKKCSSNALQSFDLKQKQPQSLVSSAVLEGEDLDLSSDLCHDLAVLLSGPRLKMLTWDLSWKELSEYCLSYMADTEEGTKTLAATELKFVHLDYSQYKIKEPEVQDIYFGIEKGYEHHLELEDDEWEENDVVEEPHYETFSDCSDVSESKQKSKKPKKKSSKKSEDSDYRSRVKTEKVIKSVKKDSSREKKKTKGNRKLKTSSTESDGISDDTKERYGFMRTYPGKLIFAGNNIASLKTYQKKSSFNLFNYPKTTDDDKLQIKREGPEHNPLLNQLLTNPNPYFIHNNINSMPSSSYTATSSAIRYDYHKNPIVSSSSEVSTTPSAILKKTKSSLLSFRKPNFNANNITKLTQSLQHNMYAHPLHYHKDIAVKIEQPSSSQQSNITVKTEGSSRLECMLKEPIRYEYCNMTPSWQKRIIECQNYNMVKNPMKSESATPNHSQTEDSMRFDSERKANAMSESNQNERTLLRNKLMALQDSESNKFRRKPQEDPTNSGCSSDNLQRQSVIASTSSQPDLSLSVLNKETAHSQKVIDYASLQAVSPLETKAAESDVKTHINSNSIVHTHGCSSLVKEVSIDAKTSNRPVPVDTDNRIDAKALHSNTIPEDVLRNDTRIAKHSQLSSTETDRSEKLNLVKQQLKTICMEKICRTIQNESTHFKSFVTEKSRTMSKKNKKEEEAETFKKLIKVYKAKFIEESEKKAAQSCKKTQPHLEGKANFTTESEKKAAQCKKTQSLSEENNFTTESEKKATQPSKKILPPSEEKNITAESEKKTAQPSKKTQPVSEGKANFTAESEKKTASEEKNFTTEPEKKSTQPSKKNQPISEGKANFTAESEKKATQSSKKTQPLSDGKANLTTESEKKAAQPSKKTKSITEGKANFTAESEKKAAQSNKKTQPPSEGKVKITVESEKKAVQSSKKNQSLSANITADTEKKAAQPCKKTQTPILIKSTSLQRTIKASHIPIETSLIKQDVYLEIVKNKPTILKNHHNNILKKSSGPVSKTLSSKKSEKHKKSTKILRPLNVIVKRVSKAFINHDRVLKQDEHLSNIDNIEEQESQTDPLSVDIGDMKQKNLPKSPSDTDDVAEQESHHKRTTFIVNNVMKDTVNNVSDEQSSSLGMEQPVFNIVKNNEATDINLCNTSENKPKADVPKAKHATREVKVALTPIEEILKSMNCKIENDVTVKASHKVFKALNFASSLKKPSMRSKLSKAHKLSNSNSKTVQLPRKTSGKTNDVNLRTARIHTDETDKISKNVDVENKSDSDSPLIIYDKEKSVREKDVIDVENPIDGADSDDVIIVEVEEPNNVSLKNNKDGKNFFQKFKKIATFVRDANKTTKAKLLTSKADDSEVLECIESDLDSSKNIEFLECRAKSNKKVKDKSVEISQAPRQIAVIELSDDDNSDVEFVKSSDPIAIDDDITEPTTMILPEPIIPKERSQIKSIPIPPVFVTVVSAVQPTKLKNKFSKVRNKFLEKKKPEYIVYFGSKMIRIVEVSAADVKKFQMPCAVKLEKYNFNIKPKVERKNKLTSAMVLSNGNNDFDLLCNLRDFSIKLKNGINANLTKNKSDLEASRISLHAKHLIRNCSISLKNNIDLLKLKSDDLKKNNDSDAKHQRKLCGTSRSCSINNKNDSDLDQAQDDSNQSHVVEVELNESNDSLNTRPLLRDCSTSIDLNLLNNENDGFDIKKSDLKNNDSDTKRQRKLYGSSRSCSVNDKSDSDLDQAKDDSDQSDVREVELDESNDSLNTRRSLRDCSTSIDLNLINSENDRFDIKKVKLEMSEIETQDQGESGSDLMTRRSSRSTRDAIDSKSTQVDNSILKASKNGKEAKIHRDNDGNEPRYLSRLIRRRFKNKSKKFKHIRKCNISPIIIDCDLEPDETNLSVSENKTDQESSLNACNNLVSPCPDLLNKTEEIAIVNYQQPDVIPNCDQKERISISEKYDDDNSRSTYDMFINHEDIHKTYHNKSPTKKKRKLDFSLEGVVKKLKNSPTIDLPELSQVDITSVRQEDNVTDKYALSFSLKHLLTSDVECDSLDSDNDSEMKSVRVLDRSFINILSEADSVWRESEREGRHTLYSPIFNKERLFEDCPEVPVKIDSPLNNINRNNITNQKITQQGKGFCDWSGRGNMKDSSRGRQEGPAAALSDAIINRPPLALRNFFNIKPNKRFTQLQEFQKPYFNNESENVMKSSSKGFFYSDENVCNSERLANEIKSILGTNKFKDFNKKENYKGFCSKPLYDKKSILSKVPGLDNLDFMRPLQSMNIVNVVQLGQLPVTSAQQSSLSNTSTNSQSTSSGFLDISSNNTGDYRSSNENSQQSSSNENNADVDDSKIQASEKKSDEVSNSASPEKATTNDNHYNDANSQSVSSETADKPVTQEFQQSTSQKTFAENEQKEDPTESASENQITMPTSTASFISTNRGLVNLISQKLIQSPSGSQHVQMATFPKGTTINALSLQQALAQILPSSLSQSSESVIHNTAHSTGSPQVVHIVQGKNSGQSGNTFGSILVDSSQQGVMNTSAGTQVLHIVQGKSGANSNNSTILNQSQIAGTTFSGLSLVEASGHQSGNQVLHIVNTGMQGKNSNTAQVLKRVNLLTSITNPQGNNEQKMVQFVCKSTDGKPIQLNTQHQRGMVLRLQPIDNSTFNQNAKISEVQTSVTNTIVKAQEPSQQELKSRSVYEENYAKFIQNSSNPIVPSSPEKSVSLPKFNQAFGKSVYQETNSISKNSDNLEQIQNPAVSTANEQQNSQELSTLNLGQLGHIGSPPLLIRKAPSSNIVHQNVVQQVKPSIQPMNIQTIHGGVIYTRQIPVNIGGGQTINLITVPSSDMMDEVQLQGVQKQIQEKSSSSEQHEPQVIKLVSQEQSQSNSTNSHVEASCDDTNQSFSEQSQNNANNHPLLTQMRIKVPVLSKGGGQMVTGARVVRPVLQIQRNIIPGTNPAVYQQLVLTTAPTIRQPVPAPVPAVRPTRPPVTTHQESNLSSSTLEQLREFDMVLEQVKERSTTTQPNSNSSSTFSENSPQVVDNNSDIESNQSSAAPAPPAQREVLYSIGPNQTVNVTYVNQKVISKASSVLTTTYTTSDASQSSPSNQITHGLSSTISHTKPGPNTPTKLTSKSIKTKPSKPPNPSTSSASKSAPVAAKTSLQKPLEDEQTTQRILYILAEYKEQVENSPDKDKPAPRRRSNPPTNPTTSSKRKKGSGSGSSKKGGSGQSMQEMSPLGGEDAGHTMGSEDSSCGLSQGECTDNSIQGIDNQSPQSSPQKSTKKILFQPDVETPATPNPQQQRNVIIADGQTITMARPGTGKATAVLMPANYLLPMSMVKGSQQITIVTNQGPKILSVPQGEGAANTLFVQRLISPAGLKPMLTRPGQVRHVRLPANAVQNLQAFNINTSTSITHQDQSWIGTNSQPKLLVEYSSNVTNPELNIDSIKSEVSDSPTIKEEVISVGSDHMPTIKIEDTGETSGESSLGIKKEEDQEVHSIPEHFLQAHIAKSSGNTLNLIQVHSLDGGNCAKLYIRNASNLGSLIQLSNKAALSQSLNDDNADMGGIQESATNVLVRKHLHFDTQFLSGSKLNMGADGETKLSDAANHLDGNLTMSSSSNQQTFILAHSSQSDGDRILKTENHNPWSNGNGPGSDPSSSFVSFEDSPHRLSSHREDHHDMQESDGVRELADGGVSRVLRHQYSPSSSPPGPRHLYHKMFISAPAKKTFSSEIDHSASSVDDDKQFVQRHHKKHKASAVSARKNNSPFTIHHRHNPQVISIRHADDKSAVGESMDVSASASGGRPGHNSSGHSAASLRHKYAVMEHELRLQKSLSEECEDLGVDSPSASDLFPEAELLFAASPSSQFDQSQDGCVLAPARHASPSVHLTGHHMSGGSNTRDPKLSDNQPMEGAEESEFARMHPNTTFHSGEIELVGDDTGDAAMFRTSTNKLTSSGPHMMTKRVDIVRSVIEGIGNNSGSAAFASTKLPTHYSMGDLSRQTINVMSSVQSSDDFSEGADDSMNSAESKDILVNNKCLDGLMTNEIVKRDLNLASAESSICISSGIIQRNVTQVIRHASSDQLSLSGKETSEKLCSTTVNDLSENGRNFLLESGSDNRPAADSSILKSIMLERDGRDGMTCSSPDQHSELFWESNSNSNQSEERVSQAPPNLLDFSSEDSNKCCKSPLSCEESNSTDSSSLGEHNTQSHNSHHHPLRLNSVIKSSGSNSTAAEGPILHSALLSGTSNLNQDASKKPLMLNSIHKSDSNTSSSPEEDGNHTMNRRSWTRSHKGNRRVLSPRSLTTEINLGAEIETSSSEGVNIITKPSGGSMRHSGSSTPEEGSSNNRRVSLRAPGGIKRSCHCCSGADPAPPPTNTITNARRARRKPPPLN